MFFLLKFIVKLLCITLLLLLSSYVLLYGKKGSGIFRDYALTSGFLISVIGVCSL